MRQPEYLPCGNSPRSVMYFIYSAALVLGFLILLPRFLFDAFRHGKYVAGLRERLGSLASIKTYGKPVIWIHCVSVGETQAARPLVQALRQQFPKYSIYISTITLTGQNLARAIFKNDAECVFYFPFDFRRIIRKTLKAVNPAAVLIMETELWPGFLRECEAQQIPVALVNGRVSEKSFRRYGLIKNFMTRVLGDINLAIMQTDADAHRLRALGMNRDKIFVSGSLKFDVSVSPITDGLTQTFRERFHLESAAPLILAASTHAPEEQIVLDALKQLSVGSGVVPRLMIAPRHPERFGEVAALIEASGFQWSRRTAPAKQSDKRSQIILLDSIGELQSIYSLTSIAFVGGSIARNGGHNVLEPAAAGCSVITGPYTFNFSSIVETFVKAEAILQLRSGSLAEATVEISIMISDLLTDPERQRVLGERAKNLVHENRGATERTVELLRTILSGSPITRENSNSLPSVAAPNS